MLTVTHLYWLLGSILLVVALLTAADSSNAKRWSSALFWGSYGALFLVGNLLPPALVGVVVIMMALLAGFGGVGAGRPAMLPERVRRFKAKRLGNWLFLPALAIPLLTVLFTLTLKHLSLFGLPLIDSANATLLSLGLACVLTLPLALKLTGDSPLQSMKENRRLLEAMGWAVMLPQLLATLGLVFTQAGVGSAIASLSNLYLAVDNKLVAVAAYAMGMALFTMIMGNAFAAFPVITAGIGLPILLGQHHGDAAVMAAIGMFSGYCGTLMTPMAANFNIVPAALLELPDKNAVIKVQWQTALPLLMVNIALLYLLMFR
ncbi:DUF979 domain-containing protein [Aeromonas cavernicola]|uniref:DUF979 domain-containing protein n=1 Tax=Aeromonas cavernicola TaxID=1006623 RepID=A0A2H9U2C8_9GAMM|nr:DUF979 domain-containing protein [Aeromonas cavernicola]PJG58185.1 DUF979 domain-containing protein [Aeromonas cavernicola]